MTKRLNPSARLARVLEILLECNPSVRPGLEFSNPWQLLVATILSAQCTDARVNQVTPVLFECYPDAAALAAAPISRVQEIIRSIGIFRNKAQNLVAMAKMVSNHHRGEVPAQREALEALPGVGRKTASVVLGQAFGIPAFAVDTHVGRVCHRLGFAPSKEPSVVEREIAAILDPEQWVQAHLLLIFHGRRTCSARSPRCEDCPLHALCPSAGKV